MKKFLLAAMFLLALAACENVKPLDYNNGASTLDLSSPFNSKYYRNRKKSYQFIPAYRTDIKTEEDYRMTMLECRSRRLHQIEKSEYCVSELRWRRNFGDLQFLDKH